MAKKKKFYAVRKGLTPGIYETWDACKAQTSGFPGAEYKSFLSLCDAEAYIGEMTPVSPKQTFMKDFKGIPWEEPFKSVKKEKKTAKKPVVTLTKEQQSVLSMAKEGENLFITGGAGTGKTVLLRAIIKELSKNRSVMVLASTGVAASDIGGTTIHSGLRLGISIRDPKSKPKVDFKIDPVAFADTVIVDEISMCRIDTFDRIVNIISAVEAYKRKEIQLIVVGDFSQLPPVVRNEDREALLAYYPDRAVDEGAYAFLSPKWPLCAFKTVRLTETLRQENAEFAAALKKISEGDAEGLSYIQDNKSQNPIPGAIEVCSMNRQIEAINKKHIQECRDIYVSEAEVCEKGTEAVIAGDYPFPYNINYRLELGKNLKIMVLKNIYNGKGKILCVNGDTGVIKNIDKDNRILTVVLDKNGESVDICKEKFSITGYKVAEKGGKKQAVPYEKGTYTQYPCALGYAVTIHKAQGKTFSAANMHLKNIFSYGQLYVALSRVTDVKNLYFDTVEKRSKLQDPSVAAFYSGEHSDFDAPMSEKDILETVKRLLKDQEKKNKIEKFIKKLQIQD